MAELPFIPKREVKFESKTKSSLGMSGLGAIVIFLISLLILGGVLFYKRGIGVNIQKMGQEIEEQKEEFDAALINELISTSRTIEAGKTIVLQHQILSPIFKFFEENL